MCHPTNISFGEKLESIQGNAALAIIGAIKATSQEKLYKELGLKSLKLSRKLLRLCSFYKIRTTSLSVYPFRLIPRTTHSLPKKNFL